MVESKIEDALQEIDSLSIPVIVSYSLGGGPPVVREFGKLKHDDILAAETQVDLLSITKSITAISILKLVERTVLRLDESIGQILRGVPDDKAGITIHQLLTHSSGLLANCGGDHESAGKDELLRCAFSSQLLATPGLEYHYSNVGYSVLAAIVEEKSGKSFEDFLLEDVLVGIDLEYTGYASVADDDHTLQTMSSESLTNASWGGERPYWNLIGNGGLVSTADEFLRIRQALADGSVISLELLENAHTGHVPEEVGGTSYYGYGVVVWKESANGHVVWHNGGNAEYSSEWNEYRDYDLTVFAAGLQLDDSDAYTALAILWRHLKTLRQQD